MSDHTTHEDDELDLDALLAYAEPKADVRPKAETKVVSAAEEPLPFEDDILVLPQVQAATPKRTPVVSEDDGDDIATFLATTGLQSQRDVPDITKAWMKHHTFKLVTSLPEVEQIVDACIAAGKCSLDLETEGLDNRITFDAAGQPSTVHKIVGFCVAYGEAQTGYYIPVRHHPQDEGPDLNVDVAGVEAAITRLCKAAQPEPEEGQADPLSFRTYKRASQVTIDFWNAKFDQEFLYPITGIDWWHPESFEDGMLARFVGYTDEPSLSLKDQALKLLRDPDGNPYEMIKLKELFTNGRPINFPSLSPDEPGVVKYACSDAICTRLLGSHPEVLEKIRKRKDLSGTYRIEKQVIQVMRVLERNRVRVDRAKLRILLDDHTKKRDEILAKIVEFAASKGFHGFVANSPKQLSEFLFEERGLNISPKPEKNEKSNQYKTDAATLENIAKGMGENGPPVLLWIIEYREQEKMIGTYLTSLVNNPDKNDELRFAFKETGAATGRFSAPQGSASQGYSGMPIHGIPGTSALREAFIARPGYTMAKCDYAGQELRIAANVSGEMVWINEFLHGEGDLHTITARAFFNTDKPTKEQRKAAKIANFALVYGGGPASIMRATGCDKVEAARRKAAFDKAVPTFATWIKKQHKLVKEKKCIWTAFGRLISIPDIDHADQGVRAACERHSTNYPIQGSGADIMKIALIMLHKEFYRRKWLRTGGGDDSVRMLLTVHDEIVFEIRNDRVSEALPIIVDLMTAPWRMPSEPYSPKWQVPLVVEPLIGASWAGFYNWDMIKHGKKGKLSDLKPEEQEYHIEVDGKLYHKVPSWLEGLVVAGWQNGEPHGTPIEAPTQPTPDASPRPVTSAPVAAPQPAPGPPTNVSVSVSVPSPKNGSAAGPGGKIVTFRINRLTVDTLRMVRGMCSEAIDRDQGMILRMQDGFGEPVIDINLNIRVDPDLLLRLLKDRNLTDGVYLVE